MFRVTNICINNVLVILFNLIYDKLSNSDKFCVPSYRSFINVNYDLMLITKILVDLKLTWLLNYSLPLVSADEINAHQKNPTS